MCSLRALLTPYLNNYDATNVNTKHDEHVFYYPYQKQQQILWDQLAIMVSHNLLDFEMADDGVIPFCYTVLLGLIALRYMWYLLLF